jgi:hypothetical protein
MREHLRPNRVEFGIAGPGRQWYVELGAGGGAAADLGIGAGARIQALSALVQIREDQPRVVLEGVIHAIAMVRIDIDIGDAGHAAVTPQMLDDDPAVVEDAKSRGALTRSVVQAPNGYECSAARAGQDPIGRRQAGSHYAGRRLEHAAKGRSIATVQPAAARLRALHDEANVLGRMKQLQLGDQRITRLE